jgi:predicted permease
VNTVFHLCARLFPPAFRHEFGADLIDQATHDCRVARGRGRLAGLWVLLATTANLIGAALAERRHPTWVSAVHPVRHFKGVTMRRHIEHWLLDLKFGARSLRRSPGFAAVAIGTLALAFGVTAGMFSVVNTVLIHPLPYSQPDRLVYVTGTAPGSDLPPDIGVASEFFVHYRERSTLVENIALYDSFTSTMRAGEHVERIRMAAPTYTLFDTLGAVPILGRLPVAADQSTVALISDTLWETWFGRDPGVIGKTFDISGDNRTVIGVMGPDFGFPTDGTLVWIPGDINPQRITPGRFGTPMIARMKPGATPDAVAREFTALAKELPARFGGSPAYARVIDQYRSVVTPLTDELLGSAARPLWVLFGASGIVLLIACANVANLFLVRSDGRQREMAVRQAIGARRGQLLRVQFSEVLIVSGCAAVLAVVLARFTLPLLVRVAPTGVPRLAKAGVDLETVLFAAVLSLGAGLACGLLPALRASAPALLRLREGGRGMTRGRHWTRNALVVAQTALALILLVSSGLLLRSYSKLSHVNPGYSTTDIFTFQIAPSQPSLNDGPSYARFEMDFMDRLRALPGVQSVGLIENVPLDEGTANARFLSDAAGGDGTLLNTTFAGADYYKTMSIPVLAGRPFTREDATTSLGNVVISKTAAERLWPGQDPIGRRLQRVGLTTWETVVGVVGDVIQRDYRDPAQALVYFPMTGQDPKQWALPSPAYVIKTSRADTIASDVRAIVREVAPEAPMYRTFTMAGLAERSMSALSFTMLTLALVSAMALILGAIGLYGVLSYVVAERTREIGVRMALGAQPGGVRRMVVAQGAQVVGIGIVIGLIGAWPTAKQLGALLYEVQPLDPVTFAAMSVSMALVGLLASYIPARRASNVNPIQSLRE